MVGGVRPLTKETSAQTNELTPYSFCDIGRIFSSFRAIATAIAEFS